MADHDLSPRTADDILTDYDRGCRGEADIDMRSIMWEIIDAVRDSYALALRGTKQPLTREQIVEVEQTVEDFLVNSYGDD